MIYPALLARSKRFTEKRQSRRAGGKSKEMGFEKLLEKVDGLGLSDVWWELVPF